MLITTEIDCYVFSKYSGIGEKKPHKISFQLLPAIFLGV